jgi:hypothetical protein
VSSATKSNSATVRHRGQFSELAGVDGQSAAMMRGVLDHGPYDVAEGLAAHDRTVREWPREVLWAARAEKLYRVRIRGFEHLARSSERGHSIERFDVFLEIEIETFRPGCAFNKPVESLSRVCHLLRNGHHAFLRPKPGVGLIEDPRGMREEFLAGKQLLGKVVVLRFWARHEPHYSRRRIRREWRQISAPNTSAAQP